MKGKQISVPAAHREATFKLMQVLGMEMEQAYQYLKSMHYQLETAIAMKLDPQQPQTNHQNAFHYEFSSESHEEHKPNTISDAIGNSKRTNRQKSKMDNYLESKNYTKTYLIKKLKSPKSKNLRRKKHQDEIENEKIVQQFDFKCSLSKLLENQTAVSFHHELYDAFKQLWDDRKMVAIHCIKFIDKQQMMPLFKQILEFTKEIYETSLFVETFNKYLINFGIDPAHFDFDFYPFMKQYIGVGDQYSIILLRYNETDQKVELVAKLPFSSTFKFSEPQAFPNLIKKLQRDANYLKNKKEKLSNSEKRRLEEDRQLMQEQEAQYYKQLNITQQNQKSNEVVQKPVKQDLSQIRRKNRQKLKIYPEDIENAINLKVRLPNSQSIHFKLPKSERLDYIFQFIQNYESNMGFNDEINRKFDIIIPLERVSLSDKKQDTFEIIFGLSEMETLVVKQIC